MNKNTPKIKRAQGKGVLFASDIKHFPYKDISAIVAPLNEGLANKVSLKKKLENDTSWARTNALRHHRAIMNIGKYATVLPMKFGNIVASKRQLEQLLRGNYPILATAIRKICGKEEWGIKVYLNESEALKKKIDNAKSARKTKTQPGLDWYREKKEKTGAKELLYQDIEDQIEEIMKRMSVVAEEISMNETYVSMLSESKGKMILNSAFLIERQRAAQLIKEAQEIRSSMQSTGMDLTLTGPWPPYNFTKVSLSMPAKPKQRSNEKNNAIQK